MSNRTSTNGSYIPPNDDHVLQFSKLTAPCILCKETLSPEQDPPIHWLACSKHQRQTLKATPTVYQHAQNLADNAFYNLMAIQDPSDVNREAHKILWMLQGVEALGENDYRGLLESLGQHDGWADTELKREIIAIILNLMDQNGNAISTVLAIEDALHYDGVNGLLQANDLTTRVNLLRYWKTYEVEFLKVRCTARSASVYRQFSSMPRVGSDALPGRGPLGVVVWMFKLKKAANAIQHWRKEKECTVKAAKGENTFVSMSLAGSKSWNAEKWKDVQCHKAECWIPC